MTCLPSPRSPNRTGARSDGRVFSDRVQQDRAGERCRSFTHGPDCFGLKFIQDGVAESLILRHVPPHDYE
jgi:hypothetical protein